MTITREIAALYRMSVSDLKAEWLKLYGEPTRSRNKQFLFRRLAWHLQKLQYGGLSDRTEQRIAELGSDGFVRGRTPTHAVAAPVPRPTPRSRRDLRLPSPGSVISKTYKNRELLVVVREDGLELDGTMYPSATALAKAVTGSKSINGWLFLGIAKRRR